MKHYDIDKQLSEIFDRYSAFFAYSDEQFNRQKKEKVKYTSTGFRY